MKHFLAYLIIAIIFTFPLITNLPNSLPGIGNDGYVYLWNIDNFWTQINQRENPFQTNRVLYPLGTNLIFHTYAPLVSLIGFAFQNNPILFLNLFIILSFVLAATLTNILTRYLTKNSTSAFFAGLIYGFSPIMFSYLESAHYYYLFTAPLYPLSLLFYLKFFQTKKIKYFFLLFLTVLSCVGIDYYSTVLLITMLVTVTTLTLFKKSLKYFLLFIFILILSVLAANEIYSLFKNSLSPPTYYYADFCHTNLAGFFIPSTKNVFLSKISEPLHHSLSVKLSLDTPSYYLGLIIFLTSFLSLLKFRKNKFVQIFSVIFLVFFLLSLGNKIELGKLLLLSGKFTPFYWFSHLPFLYMIDCPLRFPILTQLPIAIVFAFLLKKIKSAFFLFLLAIFFLEYSYFGLNLKSTQVPNIYYQLKKIKDNRTVLELPSGLTESKQGYGYDWSIDGLHSQQMYWQTIHKKPRVGAYLSRIAPEKYQFFKTEPVISDLFNMTSLDGPLPTRQYSSSEISSFIKKFNLGFIILSPNSRQKSFENIVDLWFSAFIKSRYSQNNFILYTLLEPNSPFELK